MNKKMLAVLGLAFAMCGFVQVADPLDAARQLYLSAAYEEALESLATLPSGADVDQVDKLRALCLLALSRREEATEALENLARRRPMLQLDNSESPKLVLLFREARMRTLGPATKSLYATAKTNYERGELEIAKQQFADVLALLSEPELSKQPETADLKLLAEGFSRLVDQQLMKAAQPTPVGNSPPATAAAVTGQAPSTPPAGSRQPAGKSAVPSVPQNVETPPGKAGGSDSARPPTRAATEPTIFTEDDPGVTAPVPLDQRLPPWVPPPTLRGASFSGLIEVVIDETGRVVSASMSKSVSRSYDGLLLGAAKGWQYRPAVRDGHPVKFRRVVSIVLAPTSRQ